MIIEDKIFGTMSYDAGWERTEEISLFSKTISIRIVAKAYSGQEILNSQRNAYKEFAENTSRLSNEIERKLLEYYRKNYSVIEANTDSIPICYSLEKIDQQNILDLVTFKTLIFDRDGGYGFLCDCVWEAEDGIAIKLNGDVVVGQQDLLI